MTPGFIPPPPGTSAAAVVVVVSDSVDVGRSTVPVVVPATVVVVVLPEPASWSGRPSSSGSDPIVDVPVGDVEAVVVDTVDMVVALSVACVCVFEVVDMAV